MWWLLFLYLGTVVTSGRVTYFVYTKSSELINAKVKELGLQSAIKETPEITKLALIAWALFTPVVIALPLAYVTVDMALYLLILAPLGMKFWTKHYWFAKKAEKYGLPWWTGLLIREVECDWDYIDYAHIDSNNDIDSITTEEGIEIIKNHYKDTNKIIDVGDTFIIYGKSWHIRIKPSENGKLQADIKTNSFDKVAKLKKEVRGLFKKI